MSGTGTLGFEASSSSINAKPFVPASKLPTSALEAAALSAKEFIPGGNISQQPPKSTPSVPSSHKHDLPEGDDLLGLTAVGAVQDTSRLAAHAAQLFQDLNPFPGKEEENATAHYKLQSPRLPQYFSNSRGGKGGGRARSSANRGGYQGRGGFVPAGKAPRAAIFIPEDLRTELCQRAHLVMAQIDGEVARSMNIPESIHHYHSLVPLDALSAANEVSLPLSVRSTVLKGVSSIDGKAYALRRIDPRTTSVPPTGEILTAAHEAVVAKWGQLPPHPTLTTPKEVFLSNEGFDGIPALYFAHDYHPAAFSLEEGHLTMTEGPQGLTLLVPEEEQLWSYLCQLACGIRVAHNAGMFIGQAALSPSKVLVTGPLAPLDRTLEGKARKSSSWRLSMSSLGIEQVLMGDMLASAQRNMQSAQKDDFCALGNLVLTLACGSREASQSLDCLTAHYSKHLCHVVAGLLANSEGVGLSNWRQLAHALGDRLFDELDVVSSMSHTLVHDLTLECENGRLLRLVMKLNAICERPQLGGDEHWSETGDRYLLKLFRDFTFHQDDENGAPNLDWGVALEALNKLDAGIAEKIMLLSRDESALLVVTYADIRRCLDNSYAELELRANKQVLKTQ